MVQQSEPWAEVEALTLATANAPETVRPMLVEALLDRLCSVDARVANAVHAVLSADTESPVATELAEALRRRIDESDPPDTPAAPRTQDGRYAVDVLLLTVKENELRACLDVFGVAGGTTSLMFRDQAELWTATHSGITYGIANVGTDGNVESAIEVGKLWSHVSFQAAVLIGMAAGVRGQTALGDVIVASSVLAYEFQRMTKDGPVYRPKPYAPASREIKRVLTIGQVQPGWAKDVCEQLLASPNFEGVGPEEPEQLDATWRPRVRQGALLAGSKLIEDGSLPQMKEDIHDRILGAEMEGAGFAAACVSERIPWVIVRGVADYGEPQRRKPWQYPATFAAAALVRDAIPTGRLPLVHLRA